MACRRSTYLPRYALLVVVLLPLGVTAPFPPTQSHRLLHPRLFQVLSKAVPQLEEHHEFEYCCTSMEDASNVRVPETELHPQCLPRFLLALFG